MAKNFEKDTTCIVLYCFSFGRLNECLVPRFFRNCFIRMQRFKDPKLWQYVFLS